MPQVFEKISAIAGLVSKVAKSLEILGKALVSIAEVWRGEAKVEQGKQQSVGSGERSAEAGEGG